MYHRVIAAIFSFLLLTATAFAADLPLNQASTITLTGGTAVQQYSITLTKGQGITMVLSPHLSAGSVNFGLYDANGTTLVDSSSLGYNYSISDGVSVPLDKVVQTSGTYYVKVRGSSAQTAGSFDLGLYSAWFNPGITDASRSFYSTFNTARYIANGTYPMTALSFKTQAFRLTAQQGATVAATLKAHLTSGSLNFGLYDTKGNTIFDSSTHGYGYSIGDGVALTMSKIIRGAGTYYLKVWGTSSTTVGSFDLTVTGMDADADTDGDGLSDAAEYYLGSNLANPDTNGNGINDFDELSQGKNPAMVREFVLSETTGAGLKATALTVPYLDKPFTAQLPADGINTKATWYQFNCIKGQGLSLVLTPHLMSGNVNFGLYDANGTSLLDSSSLGYNYSMTDGVSVPLDKVIQLTGTYYVKVYGVNAQATGSYDLGIYNAWFNPGVTDANRSFFSTFNTARYLVNGNYLLTDLSFKTQLFRLTAKQGATVAATLTARLMNGNVNFGLYDTKGNTLFDSSTQGYNYSMTDGTSLTLSEIIRQSGTYYLKVWGTSSSTVGSVDLAVTGMDADADTDGDGLSDAAEYYWGTSLSLADTNANGISDALELSQGKNPAVGREFVFSETNNAGTKGAALTVPYLDKPFTAQIPGDGINVKTTWYQFSCTKGQGLALVLSPHLMSGTVNFGLYDANGTDLIDSSSLGYNYSIADGVSVALDKVIQQTGTYYVKVWGASAQASGSYDLGIYNAWFNPGVTDTNRSFYSTFNSARYLANGNYLMTDLSFKTQVFRLTAQQGATVAATLTARMMGGNLNFGLYDTKGNTLFDSSTQGYNYSMADGTSLTLAEVIRMSGTYYLKVWGTSSSAVGSFDLTVTGMDADADTDGDGLYDAAEYYLGTSVTSADTNGNGVKDADELSQGKDPAVSREFVFNETSNAGSKAAALTVPYLDKPFTALHPSDGLTVKTTWYQLSCSKGEGLSLVMSPHMMNGGLNFALYDPNGTSLLDSSSLGYNYSIADGNTVVMDKVLQQAGTYYVKVWGNSAQATGSYDLGIYNAWFNPGITDASRSLYASTNTARYLVNGSYPMTDLSFKTQMFRFTAQQGATVSATLTAHMMSGSMNFALYDSNGVSLYDSSSKGYNYSMADGVSVSVDQAIASTGVYYLKVYGVNAGAVGAFDLALSGQDAEVLTVMQSGIGSGSVAPDSGSISWIGNTGVLGTASGATVVLTATPNPGSVFSSWTGCTSANANACSVTLDDPVAVTAVFSDVAAPTISSFTLPASAASAVVAVSALSAADNIAVAGYLLTETAAAPAPTDAGWSATVPASYSFANVPIAQPTVRTLYAWAKDATGNVSAGFPASVAITIPDIVKPVITSFTIPGTGSSLTVVPTTFSATDNVLVTGYLLTESASTPSAGAAGWSATAPASYTFASFATGFATPKTLYAWAKDAAGNVSLGSSAAISITLPDLTPPTMTGFSIPYSSVSQTVSVTRCTATDNVAVAGYLVTESATAPLASAAGWSATSPTSYSVLASIPQATPTLKTLYAWAKDAAGNVSTALYPASVTITLPDTTSPTVNAFSIPASATSATIPLSALSASDNVAVTGYKVTESATAPVASAAGWSSSPPANYTVTGALPQGAATATTLYAWAKDAAGNVSAGSSASVSITLADTTRPTVDAFSIPASAVSGTVPVSAFSASDNVSVTGYLVTESAAAPAASAAGWSSSAPTNYTITSSIPPGVATSKTLYAWAKDAAGNVSTSRSASVSLTLTGPTLALSGTTLANGAATKSPTISLSGSVAGSSFAVQKLTLSQNGGTPVPISIAADGSFTMAIVLANGSNTLVTVATDAGGNTIKDTRVVIFNPNLADFSVAIPDIVKENYVTVTGTVSAPQSTTVVLALNGAPPQPVALDGDSYSVTVSLLSGLNSVVITATDSNTGAYTKALGVTSNPAAPALSMITPAALGTAKSSVTMSGTIAEATAGTTIVVTVDGVELASQPALAADGSFSFDIPGLAVGRYVILITATDLSGNTSTLQRNVIRTNPSGCARDGVSPPTVGDALTALRSAVNLFSLTADQKLFLDVAPLVNGAPAPNNSVDVSDALQILRRVVGLVTW